MKQSNQSDRSAITTASIAQAEARAELKSTDIVDFCANTSSLLLNIISATSQQQASDYGHVNKLVPAILQEACLYHSSQSSLFGLHQLSYAEALSECRLDLLSGLMQEAIVLSNKNNGSVEEREAWDRIKILHTVSQQFDSQHFKGLVLTASTDLQSNLCILVEAMLACAYAHIARLPEPIRWPKLQQIRLHYKQPDAAVMLNGWL